MPNFRFTVSEHACNAWDLIVVIPWSLSNVLAGTPVAYRPFIELAKFAAQQRNHYWQYERDTGSDSSIRFARGITPYPVKGDQISVKAAADSGGNFGRLARYGIMKQYVEEMLAADVCGVAVKDWLARIIHLMRNS